MELGSRLTAAHDFAYCGLASVARAAVPDAVIRADCLLRNDRRHSAGADGPSPIDPRPPAGLSPPAIDEFPGSLTEGFTPKLRLHI